MKLIKLYISYILIIVLCITDSFGQISIPADTDTWFPLNSRAPLSPGVISMDSWLDPPAGKHGYLTIDGDSFSFEDGTAIKFWGTNNSGANCGPSKEEAENRVAWYAKMGINAVRMHKYTYANRALGDPSYSSKLTEEGWEKFDYYQSVLKEKGIYYGWSPIFRHNLVEGDRERIMAYDEIADNMEGNIWNIVNFAPDLQQVLIDLMVHMLDHKNPNTGLRYADDPALIFVELQNEDNIFWINPDKLEKTPTYKDLFCKQFSEWLKEKYGSQENLIEAWGEEGMNMFPDYRTGEDLGLMNIYPMAWFPYFAPESIENSPSPQRMFDTARFLYETQQEYYDKYVNAIRDTGYRGPLVGSCWQAGFGIIHYYNLYTDYSVGIIDRHNYFAARPHRIEKGPFPNGAMLSHPGSGLLSSGLQQVDGRPFVLSEWISKMPNEWIVEGPAIIGVYGLGLQGWSGSFHFDGSSWGFSNKLQNNNVYNTNHVTQIGAFPLLARMIHRNDVSTGETLPKRNVHIPSLKKGLIGFEEKILQNRDVKELGGDVPVEALALGKLEVNFTEEFRPTEIPDFQILIPEKVVTSTTGELEWNYEENGFFTVNTSGTQGVIGFAENSYFEMEDLSIEMVSPFGMVFITSLQKNETLAGSDSWLITTLARTRNSGMEIEYERDVAKVTSIGGPPLKIEPVTAYLSLKKEGEAYLVPLDHDGRRTDQRIRVRDGNVTLDGEKYRTFWYLIEFE